MMKQDNDTTKWSLYVNTGNTIPVTIKWPELFY